MDDARVSRFSLAWKTLKRLICRVMVLRVFAITLSWWQFKLVYGGNNNDHVTAFDECSLRAIEYSKRWNTTVETCCWGNGGYVENGTTCRKPWYGNKIILQNTISIIFVEKIRNKNDLTCVGVLCFTVCSALLDWAIWKLFYRVLDLELFRSWVIFIENFLKNLI